MSNAPISDTPVERGLGAILVIIPTYNEAENIESIVGAAARSSVPEAHVLVADDNSPGRHRASSPTRWPPRTTTST